ncbi:hypothetical protein [Phormidesmis priestleyi]
MVLLVLQRFSALDAALTLTTSRDVVLAATLLPKVVEFCLVRHFWNYAMATSEATSSPLLMLVAGRVRLKPFVVSHVGGSSTNTSLPALFGFSARDWGYRPSLSMPTA